ncbi:MAG: hypothetical protein KJO81_00500 [Gammaproteobacteria bacterium]|nr:hypothetical protein [Gammaproteobacteria bacterium]
MRFGKLEDGFEISARLIAVALVCLLAACHTKEELYSQLLGSWEGRHGQSSWCVTYSSGKGDDTAANIYYLIDLGSGKSFERHDKGYWLATRGGRFFHNLAVTHEQDGTPIPEEDRAASKQFYFVVDINEHEFTYRSKDSDVEYTNTRVDSCVGFNKWAVASDAADG